MTILVYSLIVVILDQVTKELARSFMSPHQSIRILGDFFRLTYVENKGIAFGINFANGSVIFPIISAIATLVVIYYLWTIRYGNRLLRLSLALILGGAVGNLIDRTFFGKVIDFFDFSIAGYHWPVFNVADSSVTIGMFIFLYVSFAKKSKSKSFKSNNH